MGTCGKEELDQLRKRGTWILTEKPANAIPINNKWVFTKKYNKDSDLLRYKGRLVVKGCAQRPGQDYTETFSPVVRLETLRAILALAVQKDLHIRQLDVKGAYLNGTLKEKVYMRQPEGYDDKTRRVCRLIKKLYGLKQLGREWNNELQFLVNATQPDIAYAVNCLAAYSANSTLQHMSALKRILRYLAGTKDFGITYRKTNLPENVNFFYRYSDTAYGNTDDCKFTLGYVYISGGGAITWRSKKQTTVALSSMEAEYVALSEAGREACWLRSLYCMKS